MWLGVPRGPVSICETLWSLPWDSSQGQRGHCTTNLRSVVWGGLAPGKTCSLGRQPGDINSSKGPLSIDRVLGAIHIVMLCSSSSSR